MANRAKKKKIVETLRHEDASRKNIPTAEFQSVMRKEEQTPIRVAYERRNRDLDPQLVWRGKDEQDWSDLVVPAPPLYIQEKLHPKVLIDDLLKRTEEDEQSGTMQQTDLFADFNGLPDSGAKTEFYQHDANWTNRMILGDSLQVMASLAEREGLRGQVQCIYIDPPYGIKFNSNFQWSTTSRDVQDGKVDHITREPEQVKAFRDTWRDGIHSYLTYLRDRLTVARDLLTDTGSVFVQIGDENEHLVRMLLSEIFGDKNYIATIMFRTTTGFASNFISSVCDYVIWFGKDKQTSKYRQLFLEKTANVESGYGYNKVELNDRTRRNLSKEEILNLSNIPQDGRLYRVGDLKSQGASKADQGFVFEGKKYTPGSNAHWKTTIQGLSNLQKARRIESLGSSIGYVRYFGDFPVSPISNYWHETANSYQEKKSYVVQTLASVIEKCILMSTDPGDLVLDPTCGSGTTAFVAEQWGRRWITVDTSRVALALTRTRIMGARYHYYLLADSREGKQKEAEITQTVPSETLSYGNIRQGFVCGRVPHITLKSIANNSEIDVIWEKYQEKLEPLRVQLNNELKEKWQEWEMPRDADEKWLTKAKDLHKQWWGQRISRQKEIDASIAAKAEFEYLYDKPYQDNSKVRVAGPFTVESLSPHRVLSVDEHDDLIEKETHRSQAEDDFAQMILDNLKTSGVQQAHKEDKIVFTSIAGWPGHYICAEGRYIEGENGSEKEKRAAIAKQVLEQGLKAYEDSTGADYNAVRREFLETLRWYFPAIHKEGSYQYPLVYTIFERIAMGHINLHHCLLSGKLSPIVPYLTHEISGHIPPPIELRARMKDDERRFRKMVECYFDLNMDRKEGALDREKEEKKLKDPFGLRIVVRELAHIGTLIKTMKKYQPEEGVTYFDREAEQTVKDYIISAKEGRGYRSLHLPFHFNSILHELQLRDWGMDYEAENTPRQAHEGAYTTAKQEFILEKTTLRQRRFLAAVFDFTSVPNSKYLR